MSGRMPRLDRDATDVLAGLQSAGVQVTLG